MIHNYFTKIIGLPEGEKTKIVSAPQFIFDSDSKIKKAYLQGLFMFDGGVDYRTGYINYISRSKKLVEEIVDLLKEMNLEPDYISLEPDRYERYKIRFRKKEKLKRCLTLFEEKSEKWWRLYEHLYGLKATTKDLKMLIKSIDKYYPRVRSDAITFSDVIKTVDFLGEKANLLTASERLDRHKTVVYEFLRKLMMKGGGGTSFIPVFEELIRNNTKPSILIYFTDGYGDYPKKPVREYPVLWVLTEHHQKPPWGYTTIIQTQ